jgi:hypothetical protein
VSAGVRYGYRIGLREAGIERFVAEVWVEMPRALELALAGARPNPAPRDFPVASTLPDASPARLEVLDVGGRRVFARDVGALGPGSHLVNLASGQALAPGVYLLRLSQGGRARTVRAVVVR